LDDQGGPVEADEAGELFVGGSCVTRGYLSRASMTAERYIPDPFAAEAGGRLYATGDVAKWNLEGYVEYLGRRDHQVKVRGLRVELGEVESILGLHPQIRHASVMPGELSGSNASLVAYVVPEPDEKIVLSELQNFVADRLPNHMVPDAIVILAALPRTAHGKIDVRALPPSSAPVSEQYEAPRTPLEAEIALIWADTLGVEAVGVRNDFFKSGGNSLAATQMISRVREARGIEIPLRMIFETTVLEDFVRRLQTV
jgi:hypothetical protein